MNTSSTVTPKVDLSAFLTIISSLKLGISSIGMALNLLVVTSAILKLVDMKPFMILLLNLSIADIFMAINMQLEYFVDEMQYLNTSPRYQGIICSILKDLDIYWVGVLNNIITMVYISFLRTSIFVNSENCQHQALSKRRVIIFLTLLWFISFGLLSPNSFIFELDEVKGCWTRYRKFYTIYGGVLGFITFMVAVIILVVNFVWALLVIRKGRNLSQSVLSTQGKKITTIFFNLLVIYILVYTPNAIKLILKGANVLDDNENIIIIHTTNTICLITTITDPVIYFFCCKSFRESLRHRITSRISSGQSS